MKKFYFNIIIILAISLSFISSATADIKQLCETYSQTTLTKLADISGIVNKKLIADGNYAKDTDIILAGFKMEYDKAKLAVNAEIQAKTVLSASEKADLQKCIDSLIDGKYNELERTYQGTVEMRAEFSKKFEAAISKMRMNGTDMAKINADLKTCTDATIDSISSYAKSLIKQDNASKKDLWQLAMIDKIGADTEKMKMDAKANIESKVVSDSPEFKKLAMLYNDQIIDSFKAFSVLILRDEIVKSNALKDKDSALSISDLVQKYKFPTELAGVYLGDSKDDVLKLFKDSKLISQKASDKTIWADTYTYESNPVLKQASVTTLYFTQNILVKIDITIPPAQGVKSLTFFKTVRADFEAKYGIFASVSSKDLDPAQISKFRTLDASEKNEKYMPRECVKYIWGGETDTTKLHGSNRGNMIIKIKETLDGKIIITAEHETLYNKAMDRFNPQRTEAKPAQSN